MGVEDSSSSGIRHTLAASPQAYQQGALSRACMVSAMCLKDAWCVCAVQVVDADTQKAMMAWYYKKQEEEKVCISLLAAPGYLRLPVMTNSSLPALLAETLSRGYD